jgi:F0F1-type ATP synthase delta subunit
LDGELESQKVRTGGKGDYHLPLMSQALTDFLQMNNIEVTKDQARMVMKEQLRKLKDKAPVVHMTFAVDADPESIQKLVSWMRDNAHPQTLLSIGLQPALVGGMYMRTPNHVHDFTMKALFSGKHAALTDKIEELASDPQVVAAPAQEAPRG